jgi:hypothetical protein
VDALDYRQPCLLHHLFRGIRITHPHPGQADQGSVVTQDERFEGTLIASPQRRDKCRLDI